MGHLTNKKSYGPLKRMTNVKKTNRKTTDKELAQKRWVTLQGSTTVAPTTAVRFKVDGPRNLGGRVGITCQCYVEEVRFKIKIMILTGKRKLRGWTSGVSFPSRTFLDPTRPIISRSSYSYLAASKRSNELPLSCCGSGTSLDLSCG